MNLDLVLHQTPGVLRYTIEDDDYWLIANVDPSLGDYYRSLLPKHCRVERSRYESHCTIVRGGRDVPPNMAAWGKYEGERVVVDYTPGVLASGPYYFLRVLSKRFEEIRTELGLSLDNAAYEPPPPPFAKWFHITVGNSKDIK